jgi:mannose-1-phosphate guanylyltransferase/phosphomannomutase
MGRPIYGHVFDGYWQDIGNLDQFRQANIDALEERVRLNIGGIRIRGNVWLGDGVDLDDLDAIEGPAYLGSYCRIARGARVGPHTVLASSVTVRERGRVVRSMVDSSTYIGRSSEVEGAIIGRGCDLRAHVRVHEGVAIGDEVTIGSESVILPGVRIYPFKEVETGSQLHESLIWESRGTTRVFGKQGVSGMVNVDLTPDIAVRLAAALGSALERGARVVASREGPAACRMIKRAMISGLQSTGVDVADLRVSPAAVARHLVKSQSHDAGFHVGVSANDPEIVRIQFFEPPGVDMSSAMQKEIEKHFTRGELRRVAAAEVGGISYPARVHETYAAELLSTIEVERVRERGFRIVVDYGRSGASYVLPLVLGPLGVEVVAAHAFAGEGPENADAAPGLAAAIGQTKRLVPAVGADLGAVFDRAAERLYLIDEEAKEVPVEQALLLFLRLIGSNGRGGKLAFPVTVTSQVDRFVEGSKLEIVRTPTSLPDLTRAAAQKDVVFAAAVGGGYVFPDFLPGYDAVASLAKLLELLAPVDRPLSALVADLPRPTLVHHQIPCPWALKGLVMRVLNERLAGRDLDLTDGIKLFEERGWSQALPDPDEPLIHLYAEGETPEASEELARELRTLVEEIEHGEAAVEPA